MTKNTRNGDTPEMRRTDTKGTVVPYRRAAAGTQPEYLHPAYRSTTLRAPRQPLIFLPHTVSEVTGPVFGDSALQPQDSDLTTQGEGEPLGERIIVHGRVLDSD